MKNTLYLLTLFLSVHVSGQDLQSLKPAVDNMISASVAQDYETIMDLTYPKVFDIAPRETVIESMKSVFDNDMMSVKLDLSNPNYKFSEIKTIKNQQFCVVKYNIGMFMTLKNTDKETAAMMIDGLQRSGQYTTVDYDDEKKTITVKGEAIMIAVADDLTQNKWKFVNYIEENFTMIFDESIKKALGL
jgi:hypothetical protein